MNEQMQVAQEKLVTLLEKSAITAGMYVRVHGDHLIVGRWDRDGPRGAKEKDDRVRLTRLNNRTYGLSVKRHTGRWERTPFRGSMQEMVTAIHSYMQHLVASY
jgi:hypothetical protein